MNTERQFIDAIVDLIKRYTPRREIWTRWECVGIDPPVFVGYGGEIRAGGADGMPLVLTGTAKNCEWKVGMQAAALCNPGGVLILDKIPSPSPPLAATPLP